MISYSLKTMVAHKVAKRGIMALSQHQSMPQASTQQPTVNDDEELSMQSISDRGNNRTLAPHSDAFKNFMTQGWDDEHSQVQPLPSSKWTPSRLATLGKRFIGERIVIPAGQLKARNNDCDYAFRPDTTFAYYTGLGEDFEPGAVLVLNPRMPQTTVTGTADPRHADVDGATHDAMLFVHPRADQSTQDYYRSAQFGEYWIGPRPGLQELNTMTGIATYDIASLRDSLSKDVGTEAHSVQLRVLRHADSEVTAMVDEIRQEAGLDDTAHNGAMDDRLYEFSAEQRMVKDSYEIGEMQRAVDATHEGFTHMLEALPQAIGVERGERILEGAFNANAREVGNDVGYGTIVASGAHAPILHWMRNNGTITNGDLLLIDAGVEVNSLYTADITRTFPVNGHFTPLQRKLYQAVLDAQQAGFEAAQPGATYHDIHFAVMRVLAEHLHAWGILPVSVEESLSPEGQQHRRWHACGCAHHLGLDVHDCAQARYESYQEGVIRPGMIFTIEPGLYFKDNDLLVPQEYRGIGIRIEDDVLMTEQGPQWISHAIPKEIDEVEAWMAQAAQAQTLVY